MPNALAIIGPVFDEVIEEQDQNGDKMEIDGKGPDATETLAAGVQCLLQCLNPATAESKGTLISSLVELGDSVNLRFYLCPGVSLCPRYPVLGISWENFPGNLSDE
jgi:hypothetical protein